MIRIRHCPTRMVYRHIKTLTDSNCKYEGREEVIKHAQLILSQKISLLQMVSSEDYQRKANSGSAIGAHIRHSLDHFNAVMQESTTEGGILDYDTRHRQSDIEKCKVAAIKNCESLLGSLNSLEFSKPIKVKFLSDPSTGNSIEQ